MKKQRYSRQRQLILDAVKRRHDHPSADQLFIDIHALDNKISRGTVYRNLNLLVENGEILHVKGPDADRFDSRLDKHYHMLCTECGTLLDAPVQYDEKLDQVVAKLAGCSIERHDTIFDIVCPKCRQEKEL